ncbi:hypothetical protein ACIGXM_35215 [Kitasatospora sp. NPDC052896]|uniref:hypothetical protein n=1 Tax=Kitasatospora sp. NPDC052896 TaxID=3364061 RepID=UPI0037C79F0A
MVRYAVHPQALEEFAAIVEAQHERLSAAGAALADVRLPPDAFGRLPDSAVLHDACARHARAGQRDRQVLLDALARTARGLRDNARAYRQAEDDAAAGLSGDG